MNRKEPPPMTNAEWVLAIDHSGGVRRFAADALPVTIGGNTDDDIRLADVAGSVQIGMLDGVFFVQPTRQTRNVRVAGERIAGSRRLTDGDVVAIDAARLTCRLADGRLSIGIDAVVTAGDTAPPDWDEVARGSAAPEEIAITPIAFRPGTAGQRSAGRRPGTGTIAVAAGFVVLAVLAWFAFTARSVELRFEPRAEQVSLPGTLFKVNIGDRYLLRSGEHRVVATAAGYYPLDTVVRVGRAPDQSLALSLTKLPGLVTVRTEPEADAEVRVNGELIGRTPLTDAEVPPGEYRVQVSAERFLPEELDLRVAGGGERQTLTAKLTPDWAPVRLVTEPAGAEVRVDGMPVGVSTPAELELGAGRRHIEARLAGYNAWQSTITVEPDQPQELPVVRLVAADGRLELASEPADAAVSVNGEFRGRTPLRLTLRPGRAHQVTLSKPGFRSVTRELSVAADSGRRVTVELEPLLGEIEVVSNPPDAEIWVNGSRHAARTPGRLELLAVSQEIEVRQEGYASVAREVTPRPGFPQQLAFDLERLDAASGGGYAATIRTGLGQELKLIPSGEFTMGTSRREQARRSNETLRPVKLSRAFYLGVREVTNAEFRQFNAEHDSGVFNGLTLNEDEQPVVRVTWEEAAQFLNWLSIRDGLQPVYEERGSTWVPMRPLRNGYRLPTEAEWEWAARFAGREEGLTFPWGAELPPPDRSGNFADISAARVLPTTLVTYNDGYPVSAPVGSFMPNALGIHDLGSNVAEWVQDFYEPGVDGAASNMVASDPLGPETGRFRVVRGPSWRSATETDLRLAYRNYSADAREDIGFRIARNLE